MKRKLAIAFAVLAGMSALAPQANASTSVKDIVGDVIVCVMAPCP